MKAIVLRYDATEDRGSAELGSGYFLKDRCCSLFEIFWKASVRYWPAMGLARWNWINGGYWQRLAACPGCDEALTVIVEGA